MLINHKTIDNGVIACTFSIIPANMERPPMGLIVNSEQKCVFNPLKIKFQVLSVKN